MHDVPKLALSDPAALMEAPSVPRLDAGVHAWAWPLDGPDDVLRRAHEVLDDVEHARAARFVKLEHRRRFAIAHGVLRVLLSRYARCAPTSLRFAASTGGKPLLVDSDLQFNLSHSAGRAVLAVSRSAVGVDVEHDRERLDPLGLASRYFFGAEHDAIRAATPDERTPTFLRYWVAKEAVLKAQGVGLAFPLDAFAVDFAADGRTARVTSQDAQRLSADWRVRMATLGPGWPVAIAAAGDGWPLVRCGGFDAA